MAEMNEVQSRRVEDGIKVLAENLEPVTIFGVPDEVLDREALLAAFRFAVKQGQEDREDHGRMSRALGQFEGFAQGISRGSQSPS